jgi:type I restriction enzyme S subunit
VSFPRYPKYKPSGLEWLGEVPAAWEVKRLRFAAQINPTKNEVAHEPRDAEVSFLPMEAIGDDGSLKLERTRPIGEIETGYTYFREGDVTVAKITPCFENGKGAVMRGLVGGFGFGTTELTVARPRTGLATSEYLHWLFSSSPFRPLGEASMYGAGGQKRVPDDFFRDFVSGLPPLVEQTAIASFLDRETAKIDVLVAEQEKLIALLKEKRQAVISHAVTKGLNPDAPMKPSGIEWLGNVPEHWEVVHLKRVASVENGTTPSRTNENYWMEGEVPWLGSGEVNQFIVTQASEFITDAALAECSLRLLPKGTVIVGMVGQGKTRGLAGVLDIEATINQNIAALSARPNMLPMYLLHVLVASYEWNREAGRGGNQAALNCELIGEIRVPVPSRAEQEAIARFLNAESGKLDTLQVEAERAITLLKERRAALISAAVTGQIDVRAVAAA